MVSSNGVKFYVVNHYRRAPKGGKKWQKWQQQQQHRVCIWVLTG